MRASVLVSHFSWLGYCCAVLVGLVTAAVLAFSLLAMGGEDGSHISDFLPAILPFIFLIFPGIFLLWLLPALCGLYIIRKLGGRSRLIWVLCGACVAAAPIFILMLILLAGSSEFSGGSFMGLIAIVAMAATSGSIATFAYRGVASQEGLKT